MAANVKKLDPNRVKPDGVIIQHGKDMKPVPINWLWRYWLARGKFHLLAGAPGQGKTTLAMAIAATIAAGGRYPDGSKATKANVLVWTGEDDPSDTLLPRFLAAGGDSRMLHFVSGVRIAGEEQPFDPGRDVPALRNAIAELGGVDLLVVDPVVGAVTGDSHKNTETRRGLQPLMDLAEESDCAVLGITHFSKAGQGGDPAQRVIGSIAFTAAARIVLVAAKIKGEEGADQRIIARAKSNIGPDDGGFEYHIAQAEPIPGIPASCILWGKSVQGTARELLTDPNEDEPESGTDVQDILAQELAGGGWFPANHINSQMAVHGFNKKQVWAASKKLAVRRIRSGFQGGWYLALNPLKPAPDESEIVTKKPKSDPIDSQKLPNDSIDSTFRKRESMESLESMEAPAVTNSAQIEDMAIKSEAPKTAAGQEEI